MSAMHAGPCSQPLRCHGTVGHMHMQHQRQQQLTQLHHTAGCSLQGSSRRQAGWSAGCTLSRRRQRLRVQAKLLPARRKQSLNQRIRTAKSAIERTADHLRAQLMANQAVSNLVRQLNMLLVLPLQSLLHRLQKGWQFVVEDYYEFCADETTRKWQWENRTRRETAFWNAVGLWLGGFCYTAVYMVLTPASWVFTIIIPLIYSLIIFDKPFVSPVVFAMLMASPFKFVPYCPVPLVW